MADNYLERRMEDYRSGRLAPAGRRTSRRSPAEPLAGVKALVTGGARGIGRAIVEAFRGAGAMVAIFDCDSRTGSATAQATGARFYPCDIADLPALRAAMSRLLSDWGDIDVLVNNAGVFTAAPLADTPAEEFERIMRINLTAPYELCRLLAIHRTASPSDERRPGRVINISSTRAFQSEPDTAPYSASKGALTALTHSLAVTLGPLGFTVNAIAPGWIETGPREALRPVDHDCHPAGRVGTPADIARTCLFLADPAADFITGTTITVDGGMTRRMIYPD